MFEFLNLREFDVFTFLRQNKHKLQDKVKIRGLVSMPNEGRCIQTPAQIISCHFGLDPI